MNPDRDDVKPWAGDWRHKTPSIEQIREHMRDGGYWAITCSDAPPRIVRLEIVGPFAKRRSTQSLRDTYADTINVDVGNWEKTGVFECDTGTVREEYRRGGYVVPLRLTGETMVWPEEPGAEAAPAPAKEPDVWSRFATAITGVEASDERHAYRRRLAKGAVYEAIYGGVPLAPSLGKMAPAARLADPVVQARITEALRHVLEHLQKHDHIPSATDVPASVRLPWGQP